MDDKLSVIVKKSGLEEIKAKVLLDKFSTYFQIAGEWEAKAKQIVVSNKEQVAEMQMARVGRLFLKEKRVAIEHTRKSLKENALREGRTIDGIAKVLKDLIVPIEEYLEKQEKYVEIKIAEEEKRKAIAEAEREQIEIDARAEEERIAKEKAEEEEKEKIKKENERLKEEVKERNKKITEQQIEVVKAEAKTEEVKEEKKAVEARMIECPFCHRSFVSEGKE